MLEMFPLVFDLGSASARASMQSTTSAQCPKPVSCQPFHLLATLSTSALCYVAVPKVMVECIFPGVIVEDYVVSLALLPMDLTLCRPFQAGRLYVRTMTLRNEV
jgi:hypothetical protein